VAIVALMKADNITTVIPLWRADAGNIGLQAGVRALFPGTGRVVKTGVEYSATTTSYAATIAALKTQVTAAIAEKGGSTAGIAIMHAAFDEVVDIFVLASADPVLASVRWYGTDGTALNEPLKANATASAFARTVGFSSPSPGADNGGRDRWQPIAARIQARAGSQPDAFALAVYDAVWLIAESYLNSGKGDVTALKAGFVTAADNFYGASGWTKLNAAGDRAYGAFDFWALVQQGPGTSPFWSIKAQYNTQTGQLTRLLQ
jgi:branched-chain amino acid transport system substrate-binding protein